MTAPRSRPSTSVLLLVLLFGALAVGAAASMLESAVGTGPNGSAPVAEVYFGNDVIVVAIVVLFAALVAPIVYHRLQGGGALPGQFVLGVLVTLLLLVGFVILFQHLLGGPAAAPSSNVTSNGTAPPPPNPKGLGNGSGGTPVVVHLPSWGPLAAFAVIATVAVVVVFPRVRTYLAERREAKPPGARAEATRAALHRAAGRLAGGSDPREVVRELYARLLDRVQPLAGNLDPATPDEIRSGPLRELGIRAEAAEALTRLFEEARYSTHPMGPEAAERAARAIRDAESDLARRPEDG
jgi:hypothetical protein